VPVRLIELPPSEVPKPVIRDLPLDVGTGAITADTTLDIKHDPDFADFTHVNDHNGDDEVHHDESMDEFTGFQDPLESMDMDLGGFHNVTGEGNGEHQQWEEIQKLMGAEESSDKEVKEAPPVAADAKPEDVEEPANAVEGDDAEDVSVVPALDEAGAETFEPPPSEPVVVDPGVEITVAALEEAVPAGLADAAAEEELPTVDVAPVVEEHPQDAAASVVDREEPNTEATIEEEKGGFESTALSGFMVPEALDATADDSELKVTVEDIPEGAENSV
jgi:hypothetical protein